MINESLAKVSDLAFEAAMVGYVVALVCFGIEFAAKRGAVPTAAEAASASLRAVQRSRSSVLQPVGAGPVTGGDTSGIGHLAPRRSREVAPLAVRFGLAGVVVTLVSFAAHLVCIVTRGLAAGRAPWGNMYEFATMICAAAVACFLVLLVRTRMRSIGFFVLIPVVILMYITGTKLHTDAGVLVPALHSYWLVIHVLAVSLSTGVLMIAGVASVMYLLRSRYERKLAADTEWAAAHPADSGTGTGTGTSTAASAPQALVARQSRLASLPSLATLDRMAYRTTIVAFPVYTFAVIAGAMWAESAWGRYWGWDPKETCAFVTWVVYAGYLHARSTAGWRGTKSAWISVVGFASMLFNLFFINIVVSGLHSYAGLN